MEDLNDKVTGGTLTATEWNQVPSEIQNVIEESAIVLSSGDVTQQLQAIYNIARRASMFSDSSGAVNSIILTSVSSQPATEYRTGMTVNFSPNFTNTGPVTIDVDGLGVQNVVAQFGGGALTGGEISDFTTLIYDGSDFFIYVSLGTLSGNAVYANASSVLFRNQADSADVGVISFDSSDQTEVGDAGFVTNIVGTTIDLTTASDIDINAGTSLTIDTTTGSIDVNAGTDYTVRVNTSELCISAVANGSVALYYNGVQAFVTSDTTSSSFTSAARVDDVDGNPRDVGYNILPPEASAIADTLERANVSRMLDYTGTGGHTFTVDTDANNPDGSMWMVSNSSSNDSSLAIAVSGISVLTWMAAGAVTTGARVLEVGGIITIHKFATNDYRVWGSGLS